MNSKYFVSVFCPNIALGFFLQFYNLEDIFVVLLITYLVFTKFL